MAEEDDEHDSLLLLLRSKQYVYISKCEVQVYNILLRTSAYKNINYTLSTESLMGIILLLIIIAPRFMAQVYPHPRPVHANNKNISTTHPTGGAMGDVIICHRGSSWLVFVCGGHRQLQSCLDYMHSNPSASVFTVFRAGTRAKCIFILPSFSLRHNF